MGSSNYKERIYYVNVALPLRNYQVITITTIYMIPAKVWFLSFLNPQVRLRHKYVSAQSCA